MGNNKTLVPGTYEVCWEDTKSPKRHISTVILDRECTACDFEAFLRTQLSGFWALRSFENSSACYRLLNVIESAPRAVAIINYTSEDEINSLINDGYEIREFVKDKCILQLKNISII